MKKRILIAALTAAMASSIFGVTVNAAESDQNYNEIREEQVTSKNLKIKKMILS